MPVDPPSEVQITVTVVPRGRGRRMRERLRALQRPRRLVAITSAAAALTAAVLIAATTLGGHEQAAESAAPAEVAVAFGYPLKCLTVEVAGSFAHAHIDRSGRCARYRGYLNASFHLIGGHWRLVLDEGQLFVPNALLVGTR